MSAESTSHAPAVKPERQHSLWESPDHSVAIYLTFEVIDAINQALTQMAAAPPVRGAEIGGFLLGKSERRERLTVWIDRFEPVPCSYPRGASWMLSEEEKDELADRLGEPRDAQVVGFFRSHTRKDLFLGEDDVALFSRFFADAANVFLLVKPFTTRPSVGGFFYWEGGSIHRTGSHQEFPFHRRELGGGEPVAVAVPPPQAWVRTEEPSAVADKAVPSEREDFQEPMFLREAGRGGGSNVSLIKKLGYLLGFVVVCLVGYFAYSRYGGHSVERMLARQSSNVPSRVARPEGTLRPSAVEGEKNITLTWDGTSPIVAAATHGTVEITEGSFHKTLEMSSGDLRAGRVVYSRPDAISDTVSFRIQLDTGQGEPFSEAVRLVSRGAVAAPVAPAASAPARTTAAVVSKPKALPRPPVIAEIKQAETKTAVVALPSPPVEAPKVVEPKAAEAPKILRPAPRREP